MRIRSSRIWALAALALCAFPAARRLSEPIGDPFHLPATPLDRTQIAGARDWAFLQECRRRVPAGASLTVVAADPAEEGALFMMALGVFPANPIWPSSYYGAPVEDGSRAEYVLMRRGAARPPGLEILADWDDGAIGRRRR
jgi:hypothetical protein